LLLLIEKPTSLEKGRNPLCVTVEGTLNRQVKWIIKVGDNESLVKETLREGEGRSSWGVGCDGTTLSFQKMIFGLDLGSRGDEPEERLSSRELFTEDRDGHRGIIFHLLEIKRRQSNEEEGQGRGGRRMVTLRENFSTGGT
jgi:hypothetical protein